MVLIFPSPKVFFCRYLPTSGSKIGNRTKMVQKRHLIALYVLLEKGAVSSGAHCMLYSFALQLTDCFPPDTAWLFKPSPTFKCQSHPAAGTVPGTQPPTVPAEF